jgi:hypothetical protein
VRRRLIALVLISSFLYSTLATAELKLFPMWERMECAEEEQFACYTFDQAKIILKLDIDLQEKLSVLPKLEQNIVDLKLSLEKSDEALLAEKKAKDILAIRFKQKNAAFGTMTLLYQKANQRDALGGALPWIVTAVILCAAAGFVGGVYVGKKL